MSHTPPERRRVVAVLGGGVAGLTAAYRLTRGPDAPEVVLLEGSGRVGGIIHTETAPGFVMERGPDCFISNKPAGVGLAEELGLADELIPTNPQRRRSFILRGGRLVPIPKGFYLMAPASLEELRATPLFSDEGKARIAAETDIPPRPDDGRDESLADFVRRRLGEECLVRFAQPMVAGITTTDPEKMSMAALMPQFLRYEQEHGSVIRALQHKAKQEAAEAQASGPRYGLFLSLRGGMQRLTDALAAALPAGCVRTGERVASLRRNGDRWSVGMAHGPTVEADAVICTLPAPVAATVLAEVAPELAAELGRIEYAPCAAVNIVADRGQVAHPLDGMGFVVPAIERRFVIACSFSSVKFAGRAPEGSVLLRAFVGGALAAGDVFLSDPDMTARVLADLRDIVGLTGVPREVRVVRWPESMPQYHLGHLDRVARIERLAAELPGFAMAGNAYRGVGIPDTIQSAAEAVRKCLL
jgi:oxygen-dependent protoporphyrinogen oxidase